MDDGAGERKKKAEKKNGSTRNQIDVIIMQSGACKKSAVRVERGWRYGRRPIMIKEARVRLKVGQTGAINIECFDFVSVGSPSCN